MSFNWTQLIPGVGHEFDHIATLGLAATAAVTLGTVARIGLGKGEAAVVPAGKVSVRGAFEFLTEGIGGMTEMVIGHHGRKFIPFFTAVFFFVLLNNLIGVIPGMTPATENINTTFGFGLFMFIAYNFLGIKEVGFVNHIKHLAGPVWYMAWLMFPIELISHLVRPFSLGLRLANVMMGDHTVLSVFLNLAPALVPIPFYLMGIFVCFVQAFVFTLLSMVYVAFAIAHEEH